MYQLLVALCIGGAAWSAVLLRIASRRGQLPVGVLSAVSSLGTLVIVVPEYMHLTAFTGTDILERVGNYSIISILAATPHAFALFDSCLPAVYIGEFVALGLRPRPGAASNKIALNRRSLTRAFVAVSLLLGTAARFAVSSQKGGTISGRGTQSGLGFLTTTNWLLVCAAIVLLEERDAFRRRPRALLITYCIVLTATSFSRSPFVLVGCYLILKGVSRIANRRITPKFLLISLICVYCASILLSLISVYRGDHIRHENFSLLSSLFSIGSNPLYSLPTTANVNTFDGAIFTSLLAHQGVHAGPGSWLVAITTFVPSQLWHTKPVPLSTSLSAHYLGFGTSGMFLSGAGYAFMTSGQNLFAAAGDWFCLTLSISWYFIRRPARSQFPHLWQSLAIFLFVILWFEGDAFGIYYVLSIGIAAWFALVLARTALRYASGRHRPTVPSPADRLQVCGSPGFIE